MQIALEHLTLSAVTPGLLALRIDIEDLPAGSDPVGTGFARQLRVAIDQHAGAEPAA